MCLFFRYISILYMRWCLVKGYFYIDLSDIKWGWKFYGCLAIIKIYRNFKICNRNGDWNVILNSFLFDFYLIRSLAHSLPKKNLCSACHSELKMGKLLKQSIPPSTSSVPKYRWTFKQICNWNSQLMTFYEMYLLSSGFISSNKLKIWFDSIVSKAYNGMYQSTNIIWLDSVSLSEWILNLIMCINFIF